MVFKFLIDILTSPFLGYMETLFYYIGELLSIDFTKHQTFLIFISRILILILLFFFVVLLGFLGKRLVFNWIMKSMHQVVLRIPLISTIYRACRDIILAVLSEDKKLFSRVVVVPFPNESSHTMGLVAGNAPHEAQAKNPSLDSGKQLKSVFVPTSPHPISGFLLLIQENKLHSVNISLEDAFKYLISCGTFVPEDPPSSDP